MLVTRQLLVAIDFYSIPNPHPPMEVNGYQQLFGLFTSSNDSTFIFGWINPVNVPNYNILWKYIWLP